MTVRVCSVGKIKEKFYREALSEYGKRLLAYCKLEMIEVADEKTKEGSSLSEDRLILEKEGRRLLEKIPERDSPGHKGKGTGFRRVCQENGEALPGREKRYYFCDWRLPGIK